MRGPACVLLLVLVQLATLAAAPVAAPPAAGDPEAGAVLGYSEAVILGLVEGVTEYLPISSTGHLILTNALLGLNADVPARRADGTPVQTDDGGVLRAYTVREAAYAYAIGIQAGAILAVLLLYRRRIWKVVRGCLGRDAEGLALARNLILAFLPAAALGLLLDDWIESALGGNVHAVSGALVVGAIVMFAAEAWRKKNHGIREPGGGPELHEIAPSRALLIGLCQCGALWPGMSRSMATIVGGYLVGFSPVRAAEFSFLLGLITLSAASAYKLITDGGEMLGAMSPRPVIIGSLVAFASAALVVKSLVSYLGKHGLAFFAWYRIGLAILVVLWST
jgi:undecaprenyl-diphosphatase